MKYLLSLCLFLWLLPNWSTAQNDWTTLKGEGYHIQHPEDWTVNESGMMGAKFFLMSPPAGADDNFYENINYIITTVGPTNGITAKQFADATIAQIGRLMADPKLVSAKEVKVNNLNYLRVEYTAVQNEVPLYFVQYAHFEGDDMHLLTFTAHIDTYKTYSKTAEQIIATFGLK